ncbi:probable L-gulonolactone oxidase 4 [Physcomitrium patens]|uniref:FAD-binding PCMH-type domain-containing protein n=1 Tax=Physcomitrium patens TaxID=3218 RepID=A0A2K1KH35_PHYPA|nr:probable L-gulonolactone oxidase 4 [Physcomitrium patens]PNR53087.1 hypothetical protein PHYPA_009462 [Physcomitrium patens]|eukprot:XP_024379015.1 probable L-gulonolactone oxidase 4 [Physcomitrella patens]
MGSRGRVSGVLFSVFVSLSCCAVVLPVGGGLLRDVNLASASVSEAYSHKDSATTLYSADNYLKCTSDHHITPRSTNEVKELIQLHASGDQPVKIRATRRGFHSSAGFVCSGSRGSSKKQHAETDTSSGKETDSRATSFTVLLHLMNRVVAVDVERYRLTVEAGMTLLELVNAAEAHDMSVPAGALSLYSNLTVGGIVMASAHGSGFRVAGSLGDLVVRIKWVNAKGEVIVSDLQTENGVKEVRALVGGLGLLGIATEITLQLQPNSRTIVEVRKGLKDTNMVADVKNILERETPHVILFWRPDFGTYKAVMWTQLTDENRDATTLPREYPDGKIGYYIEMEDAVANAVNKLLTKWEGDEAEELASADELNADVCNLSTVLHDVPMFLDADGTPIEHGIIPTKYAMVADDCAPKCSFHVHHMGMFTEDTEFTIKMSQLDEWIEDVKRVVKEEVAEAEARLSKRYGNGKVRWCMPPGYFWLRFGQANKNLLSTAAGSEDVVHVQWSHLHSASIPNKLCKQSRVAETLEQLTLCKYKGRPHWGKNHERIFTHPHCKVRDNYPATNIAEMQEMQNLHDPKRVFEPELFQNILQKTGPEYSELCTPHFWCYCKDDVHCPAGHQCLASSSFPEYKTCKLATSDSQYAVL